jgi:hypothetical protein
MAYRRRRQYDDCGGTVFRLCVTLLACVLGTAACHSGTGPPDHTAGSPSPAAPSRSPITTPSPVGACPSPEEFIKAMDARGWPGYRVTGRIVCVRDWATTTVEMTKVASDPAHAVLRHVGDRWRAITYGTDGLCGAPGMRPAPAGIRKALGAYC